ncbi:hypothetical protein [Helicobacter sp. 11S03491-1]|uniref:hypothetical protein n=1 Tax=Helicobacter sp. 11S03491-1 TaxID=1476196 RepID=UPI000BA63F31|nr:hypothetical protein [Helicobacter sp. 11S03491-1]PAF42619.1 hypothetical protein BKH45_03665 [Helicobacter sp. 11S03491-1]
MHDEESTINAYGEIITKDGLIEEIQSLLNRLEDSTEQTNLNSALMKSLDIHSLNSIRDSLLSKCGKEIELNLEWLQTLKNKQ